MNIVEREPLDELIPICEKKGIGITIMKPVATGLLPAQLALKWLINQPIATAVPGITTIEEVEEDALIGHLENTNLGPEENAEVKRLRDQLEHIRCRICYKCKPCPQKIPIGLILGTDVMYDHYRTMEPEAFKAFPWDFKQVENHIPQRRQRTSAILSCTRCGECEEKCPYNLPIIELLHSTVEPMKDMLRIWREQFKIEN